MGSKNIETPDVIDAEIVSDNAGAATGVVATVLTSDEVDEKRVQYSFTPGRGEMIVTTLPLESRSDKMKVVGKTQLAESLEDHIGEVLMVKDLIVQPGTAETDEGIRKVWWITFITVDDVAITTGSSVVAKSLQTMVGAFSGHENLFSEPFPIVAVKKRSNNRREFTDIAFAD